VTTFLASLLASAAVWITPLAGFRSPHGAVDELINFVINVVLMALTVVLGEELGWRGYLLPRLQGIGRNRSLVAVGLVHAIWHLPLIFLTSLYHSDGNRLLVLPLFTATLVAASFAFGYLRLATGSVWPPTVAHAVHNAAWALLGAFTVTSHPVVVEEYLAGDNGAVILGTTILAAWWIRRRLVGRSRVDSVQQPVGKRPAR
jgi:membrane protease YdiL (CAAX protease family)